LFDHATVLLKSFCDQDHRVVTRVIGSIQTRSLVFFQLFDHTTVLLESFCDQEHRVTMRVIGSIQTRSLVFFQLFDHATVLLESFCDQDHRAVTRVIGSIQTRSPCPMLLRCETKLHLLIALYMSIIFAVCKIFAATQHTTF